MSSSEEGRDDRRGPAGPEEKAAGEGADAAMQLARKRQRKNRVKKMARRMQLSLRERPVTSQAALAKTGTARKGMTTRGRAQTASA